MSSLKINAGNPISVLSRLLDRLTIDRIPQVKNGKRVPDSLPRGSYKFIPNNLVAVFNQFELIHTFMGYRPTDLKFIDVGCGIGNIMLIAQAYFYTVHGIELEPTYIKLAREILSIKKNTNKTAIFKQDILNFKDYRKYDIIYYYCPFEDPVQQKILELKIEDKTKVGAIILPFLKQSSAIIKDSRFERFGNIGYRKVST